MLPGSTSLGSLRRQKFQPYRCIQDGSCTVVHVPVVHEGHSSRRPCLVNLWLAVSRKHLSCVRRSTDLVKLVLYYCCFCLVWLSGPHSDGLVLFKSSVGFCMTLTFLSPHDRSGCFFFIESRIFGVFVEVGAPSPAGRL